MIRNCWRLFAWNPLLGAALLVLATWPLIIWWHVSNGCAVDTGGVRNALMATRCPRPWACSARRLGRLGRWLSPASHHAPTGLGFRLALVTQKSRAALQATFICNALDWLAGAGGIRIGICPYFQPGGQDSNSRITKSWRYERIFPAAQMGAFRGSLRCYAHPYREYRAVSAYARAARFSALRVQPGCRSRSAGDNGISACVGGCAASAVFKWAGSCNTVAC